MRGLMPPGTLLSSGTINASLSPTPQLETPRGDLTEHHTKLALAQIAQAALLHMLIDDRDLWLQRRINAVQLHRLHRPAHREHAFQARQTAPRPAPAGSAGLRPPQPANHPAA